MNNKQENRGEWEHYSDRMPTEKEQCLQKLRSDKLKCWGGSSPYLRENSYQKHCGLCLTSQISTACLCFWSPSAPEFPKAKLYYPSLWLQVGPPQGCASLACHLLSVIRPLRLYIILPARLNLSLTPTNTCPFPTISCVALVLIPDFASLHLAAINEVLMSHVSQCDISYNYSNLVSFYSIL